LGTGSEETTVRQRGQRKRELEGDILSWKAVGEECARDPSEKGGEKKGGSRGGKEKKGSQLMRDGEREIMGGKKMRERKA